MVLCCYMKDRMVQGLFNVYPKVKRTELKVINFLFDTLWRSLVYEAETQGSATESLDNFASQFNSFINDSCL